MNLLSIFGGNKTNANESVPLNEDPFMDIISVFSDDDFDTEGANVGLVSNDVFSVVTKIANAISDLPIDSNNQYLQDLINKNPNPYTDGKSLKSSILLNMLIYGDAFCLISTDDKTGLVNRIDLLPTCQVTINVNGSNSNLTYYYAPTEQNYSESQVLHFKMPSMDGVRGISPLLSLKPDLRLSRAGKKMLHQYLKNGLFNKSIITVNDNLSDENKLKLKKQFEQSMKSDGNVGGSIIQDDRYIQSIKPFNTSNGSNTGLLKDIKAINDQIKRDVCAAFNLPSSILVVNSHANTSDEMSHFHSDIRCYENMLISELNKKLSGTWSIGDYINVNTPTDIANLVHFGAIDKQQAQTLLGLPTTPDKQTNNSKNQN